MCLAVACVEDGLSQIQSHMNDERSNSKLSVISSEKESG